MTKSMTLLVALLLAASVAWAASFTSVAFLWHNVIGALVVVIVGLGISTVSQK